MRQGDAEFALFCRPCTDPPGHLHPAFPPSPFPPRPGDNTPRPSAARRSLGAQGLRAGRDLREHHPADEDTETRKWHGSCSQLEEERQAPFPHPAHGCLRGRQGRGAEPAATWRSDTEKRAPAVPELGKLAGQGEHYMGAGPALASKDEAPLSQAEGGALTCSR